MFAREVNSHGKVGSDKGDSFVISSSPICTGFDEVVVDVMQIYEFNIEAYVYPSNMSSSFHFFFSSILMMLATTKSKRVWETLSHHRLPSQYLKLWEVSIFSK